jgi:hypothetical protein
VPHEVAPSDLDFVSDEVNTGRLSAYRRWGFASWATTRPGSVGMTLRRRSPPPPSGRQHDSSPPTTLVSTTRWRIGIDSGLLKRSRAPTGDPDCQQPPSVLDLDVSGHSLRFWRRSPRRPAVSGTSTRAADRDVVRGRDTVVDPAIVVDTSTTRRDPHQRHLPRHHRDRDGRRHGRQG